MILLRRPYRHDRRRCSSNEIGDAQSFLGIYKNKCASPDNHSSQRALACQGEGRGGVSNVSLQNSWILVFHVHTYTFEYPIDIQTHE